MSWRKCYAELGFCQGLLDFTRPVASGAGRHGAKPEEQLEPLSQILRLLNERFGTDFKEEDRQFLETLEEKLDADAGMAASFAVNTRENARLTFDHKVRDHVQDMIDTNFKFFKQINDKPEFANFLNDLLFDRYAERKSAVPGDEGRERHEANSVLTIGEE